MKINNALAKDQCLIVALEGDISHKVLWTNRLKDLLEQGYRHFVMDLKKEHHVDAAGLGALVAAWNIIHAANGEMRLARISERTLRLLQATGLDAVFEIYNTPEQAIGSICKTQRITENEGLKTEHRSRACA
jgi:anti-anti-sigma factor